MKAYREDPKFAWIWLTRLAHDSINEIYAADKDFFEFLVENRNQLNNSFLFLIGDHGLRFGQSMLSELGKKEVNNPMLIASIPHELRKYDIYSQMQENSLELQTQFDLRATLMDILKHQPNEGFISSQYHRDFKERGSSFLREQPKPRTCKTLPISFAYCPCNFPKENLEPDSDFALEMGKSAIEVIKNRLIKANVYHMCQPMELDRVLELYVYTPETVTKAYSLVVKTKEIDQEFSLTVRNLNNTWQFSKSIDRINQYVHIRAGRNICE
ncbi:hypothetical protein WR25_20616 [Diploscapter pachys]|uniref:Uncharacterized protein n=1 Tax=Diploscapter pachys TaxID=2018661 RepID=A0A2A2KZQ7_9BILA|nr:hypothetical protein WR25_20616 [Diploscapter pachys]